MCHSSGWHWTIEPLCFRRILWRLNDSLPTASLCNINSAGSFGIQSCCVFQYKCQTRLQWVHVDYEKGLFGARTRASHQSRQVIWILCIDPIAAFVAIVIYGIRKNLHSTSIKRRVYCVFPRNNSPVKTVSCLARDHWHCVIRQCVGECVFCVPMLAHTFSYLVQCFGAPADGSVRK